MERVFSKRNKGDPLVFLDNIKRYDVQNTRKAEKSQLCLVFSQHFSRVLLRHSVLYYCLETRAMLLYSLSIVQLNG